MSWAARTGDERIVAQYFHAEALGALANHGAERIAPPAVIKASVKLALADYYSSIRDVRAVALYEDLLGKIDAPPSERVITPVPLLGLASYYESVGDFGKAAETRLRANHYTTLPQQLGDAAISAARLYERAGDSAKAQQIYASIGNYRNAWFTGMAARDQAVKLMAQGKHEEARKLLQTPVTGDYADQITSQ